MLPEQIYTLRRKQGLSQEQLAEKLGVSRQTVSKWETGASTPDLPKLLALSECFGVSLDELAAGQPAAPGTEREAPQAAAPAGGRTAGLVLALLGAAVLLLTGVLLILLPGAAETLNASSAVTLNGSGMLFLLGVLCLAAGALLLLRKPRG
ncbi:MAG: helix-turn-helix transcriptional regulator [Oscillospiraceae bacterium]